MCVLCVCFYGGNIAHLDAINEMPATLNRSGTNDWFIRARIDVQKSRRRCMPPVYIILEISSYLLSHCQFLFFPLSQISWMNNFDPRHAHRRIDHMTFYKRLDSVEKSHARLYSIRQSHISNRIDPKVRPDGNYQKYQQRVGEAWAEHKYINVNSQINWPQMLGIAHMHMQRLNDISTSILCTAPVITDDSRAIAYVTQQSSVERCWFSNMLNHN